MNKDRKKDQLFLEKTVSVIMPVRNEADFIKRSLGSVLRQDYRQNLMEILVIDGMSEDGTRQKIEELLSEEKGKEKSSLKGLLNKVRILDNKSTITPTALNIGIKNAKGEIFVRVDGHCEIPKDYISKCVDLLLKSNADCAGGIIETIGLSPAAEIIALAQKSFFGVGNSTFRVGTTKKRWVKTLAFGAYRKKVFEAIGVFDEKLVRNQDDEFNYRLVQNGGKIYLDPEIKVKYYSRSSLRMLWRQYYEYGYYKVFVIRKHRAIASWRHLVPAGFVSVLTLSLLGGLFINSIFFMAVFIPYALISVTISLLYSIRNKRFFYWLPLVFFILHASYGLGFLFGLGKLSNKYFK